MQCHCTSKALITGAFGSALRRSSTLPPAFLIPSFATTQSASFSSTPSAHARKDGNPKRGQSALRHTGLNRKQKLSVRLKDLPQPVRDPERRSAVEVDEDHGLWDFFNKDRASLITPDDLHAHGRAWTAQELRRKDWEELHRLWWVCVKEMNRMKTLNLEMKRLKNLYGDYEVEERTKAIHKTMKAIQAALTERWYAWENAREVAMEDEEVNLYADPANGEQAYTPTNEERGVGADESRMLGPMSEDGSSRGEARV